MRVCLLPPPLTRLPSLSAPPPPSPPLPGSSCGSPTDRDKALCFPDSVGSTVETTRRQSPAHPSIPQFAFDATPKTSPLFFTDTSPKPKPQPQPTSNRRRKAPPLIGSRTGIARVAVESPGRGTRTQGTGTLGLGSVRDTRKNRTASAEAKEGKEEEGAKGSKEWGPGSGQVPALDDSIASTCSQHKSTDSSPTRGARYDTTRRHQKLW